MTGVEIGTVPLQALPPVRRWTVADASELEASDAESLGVSLGRKRSPYDFRLFDVEWIGPPELVALIQAHRRANVGVVFDLPFDGSPSSFRVRYAGPVSVSWLNNARATVSVRLESIP